MTPLQAYMKTLARDLPRGKYGDRLDEIAGSLGCTRLKLYQVADPCNANILKPGPAMQLEVLTLGLVPAESTNPHMADLILALPEWLKTRGMV